MNKQITMLLTAALLIGCSKPKDQQTLQQSSSTNQQEYLEQQHDVLFKKIVREGKQSDADQHALENWVQANPQMSILGSQEYLKVSQDGAYLAQDELELDRINFELGFWKEQHRAPTFEETHADFYEREEQGRAAWRQ